MKIRVASHPFEYVLKKYIKPLGLTQKQLQQHLGIGSKTLSALYNHKRGITPLTALKLAKYFAIDPELLMRMQVEYELAQAYGTHQKDIECIEPAVEHRPQKRIVVSPAKGSLFLAALNTSLSDRSKHYTRREIQQLFFTKRFTQRKRYAVKVIFTEVPVQEVLDFLREQMIPVERLRQLYHSYMTQLGGTRNPHLEWLFHDVYSTN